MLSKLRDDADDWIDLRDVCGVKVDYGCVVVEVRHGNDRRIPSPTYGEALAFAAALVERVNAVNGLAAQPAGMTLAEARDRLRPTFDELKCWKHAKIEAIRRYRERTGASLHDAKDAIEAAARSLGMQ